jgi:thiol:disulfide interchange protein DsbA
MKTIAGLVVASLSALTVWQVVNNPSEAVTAAAPAAAAPAVVAQAPAPAAPASSAATPSAPAPAEAPATGEAPVQDAPLRVAQALFREGTHYQRLPSAQPTSSPPGTIEVTEFFMYTCPHCFNFEPHLSSWLKNKPSNVNFVRVPASFNPVAELHSKAFYAAEMLGVLDDVHEDFFREFHVKRNRMSSEGAVVKFFVDHGVDKQGSSTRWARSRWTRS